ncbi:MAG TPA: ABC transporter substrate-binding protein [Stellaceae bacterium]|jgi:NitT/TauT family transport system substrate-binding protein|nr:ABC transporter substrate-binding protein [Stellaceae bacterium]
MRRRIAPILISVLTLSVLTLPAYAETIKVGLSRLLGYPAVPIGLARGYFKAQGLDVEMVFFDSAQPISVGVASGDIDFGVSGMSAGFYNLAAQGQLKLIAASGGEAPGFHAMAYLASPKAYEAGLTSPKDLAGHSVAVTQLGTSLHYSIAVAAQKFGFPLSSVAVKPLQSNTNVIAALGGGTIDAAVLPETTAATAIQKGDAKFIGWVSDLSTNLVSASACFTATKTASTRGAMVKRFLIAYRQGLKDFHDAFITADGKRQDSATAPAMVKLMEDFTGTSSDEIERTIPYVAPEGAIDAHSIDTQIAWYKSQNLIKSDIKAADIIDTRYAILLPTP